MLLVIVLLLFVPRLSFSNEDSNEGISLPSFDLYELLQGDSAQMERMDQAAQTLGVFLISNITKNLMQFSPETIHRSAKVLFDLPDDIKARYSFNSSSHFGRGYLSFGAESGLSDFFEPKEGYSYGYPFEQEKKYGWLTSPNLWPSEYPVLDQQILESVGVDFGILAKTIVQRLLSYRSLKDQQKIDISLENGDKISLMRLFHYFTVSPEDQTHSSKTFLGSSPHTDWGLLTVILQNEVSGLQFYHQERWIDVPNQSDSLIINIGDYFSLATEGVYHSPVHRVLCPTTQNRLSFVYFYYPDYESNLIESRVETSRQRPSGGLNYNTLTVSEDSNVAPTKSLEFGEYILYKWRSVLRQDKT